MCERAVTWRDFVLTELVKGRKLCGADFYWASWSFPRSDQTALPFRWWPEPDAETKKALPVGRAFLLLIVPIELALASVAGRRGCDTAKRVGWFRLVFYEAFYAASFLRKAIIPSRPESKCRAMPGMAQARMRSLWGEGSPPSPPFAEMCL